MGPPVVSRGLFHSTYSGEISPQEKPHGIFGHSFPGMLYDSSYTTVTSRGPPRKMRHLPWSVHLRRRNPRQRPLLSWPSRGEKTHENCMFRCIATWNLNGAPWLFWLEFRAGFWGVDLTFKNRGPIQVSGRWWFKMFFLLNLNKPQLGEDEDIFMTIFSQLAWNYQQSRPYQVIEGGEKREVSNREPEGEVKSETVPGCGSGHGHLPRSVCVEAPLLRFTREKRIVFFVGFPWFFSTTLGGDVWGRCHLARK